MRLPDLLSEHSKRLRQTLPKLDQALRNLRPVLSADGTLTFDGLHDSVERLHAMAAGYRSLRTDVSRLPQSDFSGRPRARDELLLSLTLTERGLTTLAVGVGEFGTPTASVMFERAGRELHAADVLGRKISGTLHLSHP